LNHDDIILLVPPTTVDTTQNSPQLVRWLGVCIVPISAIISSIIGKCHWPACRQLNPNATAASNYRQWLTSTYTYLTATYFCLSLSCEWNLTMNSNGITSNNIFVEISLSQRPFYDRTGLSLLSNVTLASVLGSISLWILCLGISSGRVRRKWRCVPTHITSLPAKFGTPPSR
jgi:hypothetical protein